MKRPESREHARFGHHVGIAFIRPLDGAQAALHSAGYTLSVAIAPLQLISILLMITGRSRQGLTDILLGTVPLNRRRG